jgi:hypothetical protein
MLRIRAQWNPYMANNLISGGLTMTTFDLDVCVSWEASRPRANRHSEGQGLRCIATDALLHNRALGHVLHFGRVASTHQKREVAHCLVFALPLVFEPDEPQQSGNLLDSDLAQGIDQPTHDSREQIQMNAFV